MWLLINTSSAFQNYRSFLKNHYSSASSEKKKQKKGHLSHIIIVSFNQTLQNQQNILDYSRELFGEKAHPNTVLSLIQIKFRNYNTSISKC